MTDLAARFDRALNTKVEEAADASLDVVRYQTELAGRLQREFGYTDHAVAFGLAGSIINSVVAGVEHLASEKRGGHQVKLPARMVPQLMQATERQWLPLCRDAQRASEAARIGQRR